MRSSRARTTVYALCLAGAWLSLLLTGVAGAQTYPQPPATPPGYPAPTTYPAPTATAPTYPAPTYPAPTATAPTYPAPTYPAPTATAPTYPAPTAAAPSPGAPAASSTAAAAGAQKPVSPPPAPAGPPSAAQIKQAKQDATDGTKLMKKKLYEDALVKLQSAYAVAPDAWVLRALAQCERETKRYARALRSYEKLQFFHLKQLNPQERASIEKSIADLKTKTGTVKFSVQPADASIWLDQTLLTSEDAQVLRLEPGKRRIIIGKDGFEPVAVETEVQAGKETPITIQLKTETKTGHVRITDDSGIPGVRVVINGRDMGPAPYEGDLEPGRYLVELRGPGAGAGPYTVTVQAKTPLPVPLRAMPMAMPQPAGR
jgi:hypothetical protein